MSIKGNHEKAKDFALPGIDAAGALKRLKVKTDTYKASLLAFVKGYSNFITGIRGAINQENSDEARRLLHMLRGAAGNIGAKGVELASRLLGTAVKEGKDELDPLVDNLEFALNTVLESIENMNKGKKHKAKSETKKGLFGIELMVSKLAALLEEHNFEALEGFRDVASHLIHPDVSEDVNRMQEQMAVFNFKAALETLKRIADTTGISILDQELKDKEKKIVLIVDDELTTVLTLPEILRKDYKVIIATNGKDALELTEKENHMPDIILLDVMMPGMIGYDVCKQLHDNPKTKDIPVIFVTILDEPKLEAHGLGVGAVDYILKPFNLDIVKARVETHLELKEHRDHLEQLVKKRTQEIEDTQREIIFILGEIVETRSEATTNHVKRVSEYIYVLTKIVGLKDEEAEILKVAAPMYNIGKIAIPDTILNKQGNLTEEEISIIKNHPRIGYDILKRSNRRIFKTAAIIAYQHHERWDGTGFPRGLKGDEIHIYARITTIADVFDDIATNRILKPPWSKNQIIEVFKKERGKQFDPALTDLFLENVDEFFAILQKYPDKY